MAESEVHLSEAARNELVSIVRRTLGEVLRAASPPAIPPPGLPELDTRRGLFVTLRVSGALRGCIGNLVPRDVLYKEVQQVAIAAATEDPRFSPMTAEELEAATIEISVLTPPVRVEDPAGLEVGRHGVVVSQFNCRAVMLPQVAVEYGWDRDTFLSQTCRKAGLPADAWRHGARIEVFEADVFGEERPSSDSESVPTE